MTRPLAVLRPEPGNAATVARAAVAGFATLSLPLFEVRALPWAVPDLAGFDSIILTSANALRFGGAGVAACRHLPVLAVGPHTAAAARSAGFDVMATGAGGGHDIAALATARGVTRALHLTGQDRTLQAGGPIAAIIPVYHSAALAIDPARLQALRDTTALLHSARAARRLALLVDAARIDRAALALAAFGASVAIAAGPGWATVETATAPDDGALFAAARRAALATGR